MIERYQDLVHSELTDHIKTHQNSTFKLVKICEYMILYMLLFISEPLSCVSEWLYGWIKWHLQTAEWSHQQFSSGECMIKWWRKSISTVLFIIKLYDYILDCFPSIKIYFPLRILFTVYSVNWISTISVK